MHGTSRRSWGVGLVCAALAVAGLAPVSGASADSPQITAVPGAPLLFGHAEFDLATVGYVQSEVFFDGTASAFEPTAPLGSDGRWDVVPGEQAPYRSRMVVNRPADAADFSGTVVVEWFNVSGSVDASPDWQHTHVELIRAGHAWVGVSAQAVGVAQLKCPDPPDASCPGGINGPTPGDAARYGTLAHPGDSFSYDIFSQAGMAVRDHADVVLGGLQPQVLIAAGESQSAGRMVTYIDAVQPLHGVYDAFFVHSRGAGGAPLSQSPLPLVSTPSPTFIREDLDAAVLVFQAENDTGGVLARQPDSDGPLRYRSYEVAGTAHFDLYGLMQAATDVGQRSTVADWFDSLRNPVAEPLENFVCATPINSGPATFVARAAIAHLHEWVTDGTPPPRADPIETESLGPVTYVRDENGNVQGGVRTPAVDAPVATLSGFGQAGSPFCFLFGTTVPFSDDELDEQYGTHGRFVSAWNRAVRRAVQAGFVLPADAADLRPVAAQSDVLKN